MIRVRRSTTTDSSPTDADVASLVAACLWCLLVDTPLFNDVDVDAVVVQLILRGAHSKPTDGVRGRVLCRNASAFPRIRVSPVATTVAATSAGRGSCRRHETTSGRFRFVITVIEYY